MVFEFFAGSNKLGDFLSWVICKELEEVQKTELLFTDKTVYSIVIKIYMDHDIKDLFNTFLEFIINQINKKKVYIDLSDHVCKTNDYKKLKQLMKLFFKKLLALNYPSFVFYSLPSSFVSNSLLEPLLLSFHKLPLKLVNVIPEKQHIY